VIDLVQALRKTDNELRSMENESLAVLEQGLRRALVGVQDELAKIYDTAKDEASQTEQLDARRKIATKLLIRIRQQLQQVADVAGPNSKAAKEITDLLHKSAAKGMAEAKDSLKAYDEVPLQGEPDWAAVRSAASASKDRLQKHSADFIAQAQTHIVDGIVRGRGLRQVSSDLRGAVGGLLADAERVVRTETVTALDNARRLQYASNGIEYVQRSAASDDRVCAWCADRDGLVYRIDEAPVCIHPYDRCANLPWRPEWVQLGIVDMEQSEQHREELLKKTGPPPDGPPPFKNNDPEPVDWRALTEQPAESRIEAPSNKTPTGALVLQGEDAQTYGKGVWGAVVPTKDETRALSEYQEEAFTAINAWLRGDMKTVENEDYDEDQIDEMVGLLDVLVNKQKTTERVLVTRNVPGSIFKKPMTDLVGSTIFDPAFMSTSLGMKSGAGGSGLGTDVAMHIEVPKGIAAYYLPAHPKAAQLDFEGENELLLGPGQELKIKRVVKEADGLWHIYGELLGGEKEPEPKPPKTEPPAPKPEPGPGPVTTRTFGSAPEVKQHLIDALKKAKAGDIEGARKMLAEVKDEDITGSAKREGLRSDILKLTGKAAVVPPEPPKPKPEPPQPPKPVPVPPKPKPEPVPPPPAKSAFTSAPAVKAHLIEAIAQAKKGNVEAARVMLAKVLPEDIEGSEKRKGLYEQLKKLVGGTAPQPQPRVPPKPVPQPAKKEEELPAWLVAKGSATTVARPGGSAIREIVSNHGNIDNEREQLKKKLDRLRTETSSLNALPITPAEKRAKLAVITKAFDATSAELEKVNIRRDKLNRDILASMKTTKDSGVTIEKSYPNGVSKQAIDKGVQTFKELVGRLDLLGYSLSGGFIAAPVNQRSSYLSSSRYIQLDTRASEATVVHELGHFLENARAVNFQKAKAFFLRRTKDEKPTKLKDLFPRFNYRPDEVVLKDKFFDPYVGKIYNSATEVISMGIEWLLIDPLEFIAKDPEHFDLICDILGITEEEVKSWEL
jgi:SPP1 gp7 family putative phage head morphogenesis protein